MRYPVATDSSFTHPLSHASVSSRVLTLSLNQFPAAKPPPAPSRQQQQQDRAASPLADRLQAELAANEDDTASVMSSEAGSVITPLKGSITSTSPDSSGRKKKRSLSIPTASMSRGAGESGSAVGGSKAARTGGKKTARGGSRGGGGRLASRRSSSVASEAIPEEDEGDDDDEL